MKLCAARFCGGSSVLHNDQVMLNTGSLCYQHQLHKLGNNDCMQCN